MTLLDKTLRIIVADKYQEHRLYIEKSLNKFGYFRIATASSYEEALKLTQVDTCLVELLIIDEHLLGADRDRQLDCDGSRLGAKHTLTYRSRSQATGLVLAGMSQLQPFMLPNLPDRQSLKMLMSIIDNSVMGDKRRLASTLGLGLP
ncbi:hypothetical protein [Pseudomonas brassicacearum]|uniref:Uncharacterized protein n=1 Tax=Pseudomonas brassicacearum TaxID=930166 RepID=A0A423GNH3_9PSED|nr:hypothetical protein [Pseudomonas brassicacearum]ROM93890.1 hypothetical protein BK658_19725 [Pseudomonas brassicacearum]